jgi:integrase
LDFNGFLHYFLHREMASVFQKPKSPYWFASFKDHQGVWRNKSTRTTNKTSARKIAETFERVAARKLNARRAAEAIRELYHELSGVEAPKATVSEFCAQWLRNKSKEKLSAATLVAYQNTVRQFLEALGKRAQEDIANLQKNDIVAFRNLLADRLSAETTNKHLKIVRMLLQAARGDGFVLEDPSESVKTLEGSGARLRRAFTLEELRKLLVIADAEWQSLIKLAIYSGQRLGDLAGLTWEQVNLNEGVIRLRTRKTGLKIEIPIVGPLREHLLRLQGANGSNRVLHPRAAAKMRAQKGRTNSLSNEFIELLVTAGLREGRTHQGTGKGRAAGRTASTLSFHCLRHTAVSMLKHAGVPDAVVMELVGHESSAMSARYTHTGTEQLAQAIQKLPSL